MSNEKFGTVKCCDRKLGRVIYWYNTGCFSLEVADYLFFDHIEHCPWCGILLDTNLLEA